MKTKPITLRFEQEHLDLLMEKEGYETPGKAINFLLARYYWSHQLSGNVAQSTRVPTGDIKTGTGKPLADMPKLQSPDRILYDSYCNRLKKAQSVGEFEELNEEIQASELDDRQKRELRFMAQGLSRKLD